MHKHGTIASKIPGPRRFSSDLPQDGLELPCEYTFTGSGSFAIIEIVLVQFEDDSSSSNTSNNNPCNTNEVLEDKKGCYYYKRGTN